METVVCVCCGGAGETHHFDEEYQEHYTLNCVICGGSGQAISERFGWPSMNKVDAPTHMGVYEWAKKYGTKMAEKWKEK
jgi:hypothetical protein